MKTGNILGILCLLAFSLVFAFKNGTGSPEMIGTYVNHASGEYSIADDTLIVEQDKGNSYLIHRRTGFNLIRDGKKASREYETEEWKAVYNAQTEVMTEIRRGKTIAFYKDRLIVGNREYQKIN